MNRPWLCLVSQSIHLSCHGTFRFYDDSTKSIVHLMVFDRMNEENVIIFRSYLRIVSALLPHMVHWPVPRQALLMMRALIEHRR